MTEILSMAKQLGMFAVSFNMIKCLKSMIAGTVMLLLILLLHVINKNKNALLNLCSFFFVLPTCFMGYSKFYFHGQLFHISNWMYQYIRPWCGFLYFFIAAVLWIRFFKRNRNRNRIVRKLPEANVECSEIIAGLTQNRILSYRLSKIKIYQTKENVSPYSGGVFRPYIVLPDTMIKTWSSKDIKVILTHEMLHIRYGHILTLYVFSMIKIYWWINPLFHFAEKKLREDMECFCDERCLYYSSEDKKSYGNLLLRTIYLVQDFPKQNVTAFFQRESFAALKERISYLNRINTRNPKIIKPLFAVFCGLFLSLVCLIGATSYPRYTRTSAISLHDETGKLLVYNTPALQNAVQINGENATVNLKTLKTLLEELQIQKSRLYLCYGTIQKTPGAGGCGNMVFVDLEDGRCFRYLASDDWRSRFQMFFIKYVI